MPHIVKFFQPQFTRSKYFIRCKIINTQNIDQFQRPCLESTRPLKIQKWRASLRFRYHQITARKRISPLLLASTRPWRVARTLQAPLFVLTSPKSARNRNLSTVKRSVTSIDFRQCASGGYTRIASSCTPGGSTSVVRRKNALILSENVEQHGAGQLGTTGGLEFCRLLAHKVRGRCDSQVFHVERERSGICAFFRENQRGHRTDFAHQVGRVGGLTGDGPHTKR